MEIMRVDPSMAGALAPLVADFRVVLKTYKGLHSAPHLENALEEVQEFLNSKHPIFVALDQKQTVGYIVCRVNDGLVWVEQLYVCPSHRRQGVASLLFEKAEGLSSKMGEETVFNFVHPNNTGMIQFLRAKGYTVLNLIEIRKPYKNEALDTTIHVNDQIFDY